MPAEPPRAVADRLAAMAPITLAELDATAALRTRLDRKYLVSWDIAARLLDALAADHRVLEIDGRRSFAYRSLYFDSPGLGAFRAHMQARRRRYKCRTRHYVDAGVHVFEVKLKGLRGATVKHQLPIAPEEARSLGARALAFAAERVSEAYDRAPEGLVPAIGTDYSRITLASGDRRVTIDHGLSFVDAAGRTAAMDPGHVIVESKSANGSGAADVALRRLGARPVECSKYCVGIALLRADDAPAHRLRRLVRRYFVGPATPAAGSAVHA